VVLKTIAEEMVDDAFANGHPNYNKNFAERAGGDRLPWIVMRRADGAISDLAAIHASCPAGRAVQLSMPFEGRKLVASKAKRPEIIRTVFSALVHELVHVRQCGADMAQYQATAQRQTTNEMPSLERTPAEWMQSYYAEELELEAHAVQLAADMRLLGMNVPVADPHGSWVQQTEVSRRVHSRLFPAEIGIDADADADAWWRSLVDVAAANQEAWNDSSASINADDATSDHEAL
jgi:hypothetical protein